MPWFAPLIPEDPTTLLWLDAAHHILHSGLIVFVLIGWLFSRLRGLHLLTLLVIWASWLGLGWYVGHLGYCFLTDWHWQVMRARGAEDLPLSYITYLLDALGAPALPERSVSLGTVAAFAAVTLLALGNWLRHRRRKGAGWLIRKRSDYQN